MVELGDLLRSFADSIPETAVLVAAAYSKLVGPVGPPEPLGVIAGMVLAMVVRAPLAARLKWFQYSDWRRVSWVLRGLVQRFQEGKSSRKPRPVFDELAQQESFDEQHGHLPVQPGDKSRV